MTCGFCDPEKRCAPCRLGTKALHAVFQETPPPHAGPLADRESAVDRSGDDPNEVWHYATEPHQPLCGSNGPLTTAYPENVTCSECLAKRVSSEATHVWVDADGKVAEHVGRCAGCGLTRAWAGPWFEYSRGPAYFGIISPMPPCDPAWPHQPERVSAEAPAREPIVWADEASPFTGPQVKALLDENETLRRERDDWKAAAQIHLETIANRQSVIESLRRERATDPASRNEVIDECAQALRALADGYINEEVREHVGWCIDEIVKLRGAP